MASFMISIIPIFLIGLLSAGLLKLLRTKGGAHFLEKKLVVTRGSLVGVCILLVCLIGMTLLKANTVIIYMLLAGILASILSGKQVKR
jgi:hypothetical protein